MEITEVLGDLPVTLLRPSDMGITTVPPETGDTYAANAQQKAKFFKQATKLPTVADDSGIVVDALADELGVHTRRWGAGEQASDEEWITYFLEAMKEKENRRAHFICHLAYVDADDELHSFEGKCSGVITKRIEAEYLPGIPISGCFKPDGCNHVFSALSVEEKNAKSHRGQASVKLREFLVSSCNGLSKE